MQANSLMNSEIKNSKIEIKQPKTQKGENKMKNIKKFNWKKLIETTKTIVIYTVIIAGLAFYFGIEQSEANIRVNNDKIDSLIVVSGDKFHKIK